MSRRLLDRPEITSHDVVTRAMHRTGSDDFDGTDWIEPLEVITRSLDREARLTVPGRRRARADLVDLLVARHGHGAPDRDADDRGRHRPTVIVTGPDPEGIGALETALGSPVGRGVALLESTFTSLSLELRWHLPAYAEWLADADLTERYLDVARHSVATPDTAPVAVVGAIEFAERTGEIAAAFPGHVLVEIRRDRDAAAAAVTTTCVAARHRDSNDVDVEKVGRYWRWRLGLRAERSAAGRAATLVVDHDHLLAAPEEVAHRVLDAVDSAQA